MDPFLSFPFLSHPVSPFKADVCERGIVDLKGAKLDASVKPNVDNTKSRDDFPVLSFAVSLGK